MKFDNSIAGLANFIFEIKNTSSIVITIVKTMLKPITFYILQVNIPFLLCPADVDKLGVFFKNLINQII